jgi:hypothetical protein
VALVADAIDELEGQIGQFCIGVDECFKKYQSRVHFFGLALGEDVSLVEDFLHFIHPQFFNE